MNIYRLLLGSNLHVMNIYMMILYQFTRNFEYLQNYYGLAIYT